ncbi:hypothetical protein Pmar_PMAR001885 [Perkinsus marinus ATCC 50983]|uniref:Uncharacterized protein n=1 Tax=Perkinsus marinus (strain ATCC 50983 / TXsc) TaxID=423536 RepID=C5LPW7_PERM5|nr:hypothetical protein Pmar_PMAR001885 [Perkinsus marinus ATCC 50983]EER01227.1 hypothetical protein Pmar_PMAR001885 [Perkinsus marinus ATCC 50983]|eukprot:XP_002768509.1 hypothetical protein Pmar_PMAR001885 [Perkinsus marinus ATCC 50983]
MPGVLARLQELLNVQPKKCGDNLRCFFDTFNQQDPPTPVSARNYDHAADEFMGLGRNSRPRPVTDINGVVRKLHDRNGQLFNVAPNSDARYSPKWFSALSISSAARSGWLPKPMMTWIGLKTLLDNIGGDVPEPV